MKNCYYGSLDRDIFCSIVDENIGYEKLFDAFCFGVVVFNGFVWFTEDDDFYIINIENGIVMNWYKHLGRCNCCSHNLTIQEYKIFFSDFNETLTEYYKGEN